MSEARKLYKALGNIAYGFIFILIHINIGAVDILPDFVGFIMITVAVISLKDECKTIKLLKPLGIFLSAWEAVTLILNFTATNTLQLAVYYLSSVVSIIEIYFYFQLFTDISLIAKKYQSENEALDKKLITRRNIYAVTQTVIYVITNLITYSSLLNDIFDIDENLSLYIVAPVAVINLIVLFMIVSALFSVRKLFSCNGISQYTEATENENGLS